MKKLYFLILIFLTSCASVEEVDRSYVNLPQMDLRSSSEFGQPSPKSGLRNWSSQAGQSSCAVCSH